MCRLKSFTILFVLLFCVTINAQTKKEVSGKRYVILKLDDVVSEGENQIVSERWQRVTRFVQEKKIKAAYGVIGYSLEKDNLPYFNWIRDLYKGGLIEFWNHGYIQRKAEDPQGEFELEYDSQLRSLRLTDSLAKVKLGITLTTWGPHWSATNEYTDKALAQIPSIEMTFGYPPHSDHFKGIILPELIDMEYPVHNPNFIEFKAAYDKLGNIPFLSYLQGHPNSWDEERWSNFVNIVNFLLNEGFEFITPEEYRSMIKNTADKDLYTRLLNTNDLVALWDFKESKGENRNSYGTGEFSLIDVNKSVSRISEGPLSGHSAFFDGNSYLVIPNKEIGRLNITSEVTVVAWVKWTGEQIGFVAGPWNEYEDGGKRQYGLFVSLPHYNGRDQVCGHISKTGKPTPPFPYSIDYSASKQTVPANEWCCIGFTYDGKYIKSYVDGIFEPRDKELINHTTGFEGYPNGITASKNPYYFPDGMGDNGSDFTVGAVLLKKGMGNFFKGQIGGVAVFSRALNEDEMKLIANPDEN